MGIIDPEQTGTGAEPDADREQEDAPFPTRFGRDARQRFRPRSKSRAEGATKEPRTAADEKDPFEDDGGL